MEYALAGFVDGLREQMGLIRDQQLNVTWDNYIFRKFKNEKVGGPASASATWSSRSHP
jgi:hypothetical protein